MSGPLEAAGAGDAGEVGVPVGVGFGAELVEGFFRRGFGGEVGAGGFEGGVADADFDGDGRGGAAEGEAGLDAGGIEG